jgi:SagB-type dehydrogenase family enzyme
MSDPDVSSPVRPTPQAERLPTLSVERTIIGGDQVALDDPTEAYHEAARLYPGIADPSVRGAALLEHSDEARASAARSVKRHRQVPRRNLPPAADLGPATLAQAFAARRSRRVYGPGPIELRELASILHAAYGANGGIAGTTQALRSTPSAGALYPLELYAACGRVEGLEPALYHYDPLDHVLERLRPIAFAKELGPVTPYPELLAESAAVVVATGVFWRSRFKYGARAYRFVLLEAGHLAQSLLLAAAALDLAVTPVGGFYDRLVDAFVDADGIHEASIYLFPLGRPA